MLTGPSMLACPWGRWQCVPLVGLVGLRQKDVAGELGANFKTYENWEQEKYEPEIRFLPAVIRFLGYDPSPSPVPLPDRIQAARRRQGISQRELARRLGLYPATVCAWETGKVRRPVPAPGPALREVCRGCVEGNSSEK